MMIQEQIEINGKFYPHCRPATPEEEAEAAEAQRKAKEEEEKRFWDMPYQQRVSELIHKRYTIDDEVALNRQREEKPEEFAEYYAFVEQCKLDAKGPETI